MVVSSYRVKMLLSMALILRSYIFCSVASLRLTSDTGENRVVGNGIFYE